MDRALVAPRAQESREGEKFGLVKRRNKSADSSDYPRDSKYVCPTTQAASPFNGSNKCYRDSYTFGGAAWQASDGDASNLFSDPP
jgi:hypothetical protein